MAWNDNLEIGTPAFGIAASEHSRIRVLAGPGTGKSFAMKRRVARLLEVDEIDPTAILAVTFTRVAAEDLHRELVSLGVPGADRLNGRTLHSLALTILMRNHVFAVLGRTPRTLNEFEVEPLLADLSAVHGNKHARRRLILAYAAAWARLQTQEPGYTRSPADQAFVDDLVTWLRFHEAMLMDEVIPHLYQYLVANPGAAERQEYRHVLVDEFQDLNRAEQDVIHFLAEHGGLCIIGDDDQSIYSFRHAYPQGIREWHTIHAADDHDIAECRRCPTTVVRMANALIARNTERLAARAMIERPANGPGEVVVRQFSSADSEAEAVAAKIRSLIGGGVSPGEIVVLAQGKTFATPIFDRLRANQIPTKSYYAETELDTTEAQERFSLLKLFLNNEDRVALRWLLGRGRDDWHNVAYGRLMRHVSEAGTSPWETMIAIVAGTLVLAHTSALRARFVEIQRDLDQLSTAADLDQFISIWLPASTETNLLSEMVQKHRGGATTPEELFDLVSEAITRPEIPVEVGEVRIMSVHKSKGLSAHFVFVVGCVEGLLPARPNAHASVDEQRAKLEEDRRLFYVGITRVKADLPNRVGYLALTYAQTMRADAAYSSQITPVRVVRGVAHLHPSRFMTEMAPHTPPAQFNRLL